MIRPSLIALAVAVSGCGGSADLGEDADARTSDGGEMGEPGGGSTASSDLVFGDGSTIDGTRLLAVSGEYLYFVWAHAAPSGSNAMRLMRCEKTNCEKTARTLLESELGTISALQIFGDRIGLVERDSTARITSCQAPDCADLAKIDGLRTDVGGIYFEAGAVEWSHLADDSLYRCTLPDCEEGPQLVLEGVGATEILRSGEVTILDDGHRIFRISGDPSALELLQLGIESRKLGGGDAEPSDTDDDVGTLAIDGDWLYASLNTGCRTEAGDCTIARWPLRGYGAREVILTGDRPLHEFSVLRGELGALTYSLDVAPWESSSVVFCRVDACSDTLREAAATGWTSALVADDERWYWAWTSDDIPSRAEIRSTPRLQVP